MAHSEILKNKPFSILVILSHLELMDTNWKAFASYTSNVNPNADFGCKRESTTHTYSIMTVKQNSISKEKHYNISKQESIVQFK